MNLLLNLENSMTENDELLFSKSLKIESKHSSDDSNNLSSSLPTMVRISTQDLILPNLNGQVTFEQLYVDHVQMPKKIEEIDLK